MSSQLLLRLGLEQQESIPAGIVSDDEDELQVKFVDNIIKNKELLEKTQTFVLFSANLVRLSQAQLPPASHSQLLKAVPFALEEKLSQAPETMHFALGKRTEEYTPVAMVDKTLFANRIAPLAKFARSMTAISEVQALPFTPTSWSVLAEADTILVRSGLYSGFRCSDHELLPFLKLALKEALIKPEHIVCYYTSNATLDFAQLQQEFRDISLQRIDVTDVYTLFAQNLKKPASPLLNLQQGDFQARGILHTSKIWRVAIAVLCLFLGLSIANFVTEFSLLKYKNKQLASNIAKLYQQIFPKATSIVAPSVRVKRELQDLTHQAEGSNWHYLFGLTAPVLQKISTVSVKKVEFRDPTLELSVQSDDLANIALLVKSLQKTGLKVTEQDAKSANSSATATLKLQR